MCRASFACVVHASTICETSTSTSRATRSSFLPASRVRANPRLPSARFTPRRSGAISNRYRPTHAVCFIKWPSPKSMKSRAYRRPSLCSNSAALRVRARPLVASRRYRTCCGCSIRARERTRRISRCSTRNRFRQTPRRERVPAVRDSAVSTKQRNTRWSPTIRSRFASVLSPHGRRHGKDKTFAISR